MPAGARTFRTFAGTIREHMQVIDSEGKVLGTVAEVRGDQIMLTASGDAPESLPVSMIDGIDANAVLLAGRGDASFGLGAQP
ncbi:hypothetical protein B2G71_15925 [Novosphingobium sp. PC22D]|nr:hypothetical protein B2G71_15925 [Novosphingobium sp. PC22D]